MMSADKELTIGLWLDRTDHSDPQWIVSEDLLDEDGNAERSRTLLATRIRREAERTAKREARTRGLRLVR